MSRRQLTDMAVSGRSPAPLLTHFSHLLLLLITEQYIAMFDVFTLSEDATLTISLRPAPRFRARSKAPPARRHPAAGRDEVKGSNHPRFPAAAWPTQSPAPPAEFAKRTSACSLQKRRRKDGRRFEVCFSTGSVCAMACAARPPYLHHRAYGVADERSSRRTLRGVVVLGAVRCPVRRARSSGKGGGGGQW